MLANLVSWPSGVGRAAAMLLVTSILPSCAKTPCLDPIETGERTVLSIYLGSSLLSDERHLRGDGEVLYRRAGGRLECAQLSSSDMARIRALLTSDAIQNALATVRKKNWINVYSDWHMITIDDGRGQIGMPVEMVPPTLVPLLALVDDVWSAEFGRYYDASLVESIEELSTVP